MAYRDPAMQRTLLRAKGRALSRLQESHNEEYNRYYEEEMLAEGFVRVPRGKGGGWAPVGSAARRETLSGGPVL
jgi:hypothetical protein